MNIYIQMGYKGIRRWERDEEVGRESKVECDINRVCEVGKEIEEMEGENERGGKGECGEKER